MKRVMIAIHALSFDGAEKVAAMWANYLSKKGCKVACLVHHRLKVEQKLDNDIEVFAIAETADQYLKKSAMQRLCATRKIVKSYAPDVIISLLPKMQMLVMLATFGMSYMRIETIRNNPWLDTDVGKRRPLWNMCFRRSDWIILQTEEQGEYFSNKMRKKSVVIRNPILHIPTQKIYEEHYVRNFVAVGRLSGQKNYLMMIRDFAQIEKENPCCTLDIYGNGSPESIETLQTLIDQAGMHDKIRLCGWIRNIPETLTQYDAFLMSSNYEGMPNALAEAMSVGLICLSTDCKTGPRDMIDSGVNGFLAKTGDEQSFAEGIEAIIKLNLQQRIAMGAAARAKILEMCSEENTLAWLQQLIEVET